MDKGVYFIGNCGSLDKPRPLAPCFLTDQIHLAIFVEGHLETVSA